jgi:hypothetical protein
VALLVTVMNDSKRRSKLDVLLKGEFWPFEFSDPDLCRFSRRTRLAAEALFFAYLSRSKHVGTQPTNTVNQFSRDHLKSE